MLFRYFISVFIALIIQIVAVFSIDAQSITDVENDSIGLVADLYTNTIDKTGKESVSEAKIHKLGMRVRYESKTGNTTEVNIYDFDLLKELRIIYQDKIYFEGRINRNFLIKAERDGLYKPLNPNVTIDKIRLREDRFDSHPTIIYLVVRSLKSGEKTIAKDYSMTWEAVDLDNLQVKIVYPLPDFSTVIVEYRNAAFQRLDPSLFMPPSEFLNLSPF